MHEIYFMKYISLLLSCQGFFWDCFEGNISWEEGYWEA
jgi:hypothetical protein